MLSIVELFYSIQGEGKYIGEPSIFIRFGGCNLACAGFGVQNPDHDSQLGCDSYYAVDVKHYKSTWQKIESAHTLFAQVMALIPNEQKLPNIVLTGGEPLINANQPEFYELITLLLDRGFNVHVETNGTIMLDFAQCPAYCHLVFAMSVKLSNSGEKYEKRVQKSAIQNIANHAQEAFFKFVLDESMVHNGSALSEINDIASTAPNLPIYCMALGKNNAELTNNAIKVIDFCLHNGFKYTDRLHIRVWNDKKGV